MPKEKKVKRHFKFYKNTVYEKSCVALVRAWAWIWIKRDRKSLSIYERFGLVYAYEAGFKCENMAKKRK